MLTRLLFAVFACLLWGNMLEAQCLPGTLSTTAPLENGALNLCTADGSADEIAFTLNVGQRGGCQVGLIVTDRNFQMLSIGDMGSFNFEGLAPEQYFVFGFSYAGTILPNRVGRNVYSVPLATGPNRLSTNRIRVEAEEARAGSITTTQGESVSYVCVGDGIADFVGFRASGKSQRSRYAYVITDVFDEIVEVLDRDFFDFQFSGAGRSRVYGLAYSGDLLLQPGQNLRASAFATRCAELTTDFVRVERDIVDGGRLATPFGEQFVLRAGDPQTVRITRTASSTGDLVYITIDERAKILQFDRTDEINYGCFEPGKYFTYAYSYNGVLQAQLGENLWNRSVPIASACFSMSSNAIVVNKQSPVDCPPSCLADGGAMIAVTDTVSIGSSSVRVEAVSLAPAVLPPGYDTTYFLTRGETDTLQAIRIDQSAFTVSSTGEYSVYRLVAEFTDSRSPDFFSLAAITFGTSTIADLEARIATGICADLSEPARVVVERVPVVVCTAAAGSLGAPATTIREQQARTEIQVFPQGDAVVPPNYETHYLLTQDLRLTVVQLASTPSFAVQETGNYRVHTFVVETSDPADPDYFDLSSIRLDTTTLTDVLVNILTRDLCADIDFSGITLEVFRESTCDLYAGTSTPAADSILLGVSGLAFLSVRPNADAVTAAGTDQRYLLTRGDLRVPEAISASSTFVVREPGTYYVHRLAGELSDRFDPDYFDLFDAFGKAAALAEVGQLIRDLGVCADLDPYGTPVEVVAPVSTRSSRAVPVALASQLGNQLLLRLPIGPEVPLRVSLSRADGRLVAEQFVAFNVSGEGRFELPTDLVPGYYVASTWSEDGVHSTPVILGN